MEAKQWFDLITHLFIFFPVAAILRFTPNKTNEIGTYVKYTLIFITVLMIIFSVIHHFFPEDKNYAALDEIFVGLSIIFVFLIYVDNVYEFKDKIFAWNRRTIITTILLVITVAVYVTIVFVDRDNDTEYLIIVVALIAIVSAFLFFYMKRWKGHDKFYIIMSVVFAALASIMFINNDLDPDFYKHSLWHTFAFISFGYLVLFAVLKKTGQNAEEAKQKKAVIGLQYAVSLSVRLLIIGYFTYAASLDDTPEGWILDCCVCIRWSCDTHRSSKNGHLKYDMEYKDIRILAHGAVQKWILVGLLEDLHWGLVFGFLSFGLLYIYLV